MDIDETDMESLVDKSPLDLYIEALPDMCGEDIRILISIKEAQKSWDMNVNDNPYGKRLVELYGRFVCYKGQVFTYKGRDFIVC